MELEMSGKSWCYVVRKTIFARAESMQKLGTNGEGNFSGKCTDPDLPGK